MFPAEIAVSRARHGRGEVFVICLRDISERHATQEALRDSEARYRSLVDNAPEAITVIDADTQPFRRGERTGVAAVQDDARTIAGQQRGRGQRRDAGRRPAGQLRRIAST